jgi:hypothetical protein
LLSYGIRGKAALRESVVGAIVIPIRHAPAGQAFEWPPQEHLAALRDFFTAPLACVRIVGLLTGAESPGREYLPVDDETIPAHNLSQCKAPHVIELATIKRHISPTRSL